MTFKIFRILCPRTEINSAVEEGEGRENCSKQREGQRDNNIVVNNLLIFNIYVASCNNNAIFI